MWVKPVLRYDGIGHVTGRTTYVDDIQRPGMLYIKVLGSPVHKGIIRRSGLLRRGEDARRRRRHHGQGRARRERLWADRPTSPSSPRSTSASRGSASPRWPRSMKTLPWKRWRRSSWRSRSRRRFSTPLRRCSRVRPWFGQRATYLLSTAVNPARSGSGDVEKGFTEADFIVEGKYTNSMNEHAPMEPQVSVAYIDESRPPGHPHGQPGSLLPPGDADRHLQPADE